MKKYKKPKCPPHRPSGWECCVGHGDGEGGCPQCTECGHYYRPSKVNDPCDKCAEQEQMAAGNCPKGHPAQKHERKGWMKCDLCRSSWGDGVFTQYLA